MGNLSTNYYYKISEGRIKCQDIYAYFLNTKKWTSILMSIVLDNFV